MRVLFFGGHTFGKETLSFLLAQGVLVAGVFVTETKDPWYQGVDQVAEAHGIRLWKGENVNDPRLFSQFEDLSPDLIVVVNFDQILRAPLIELPPKGCINIHAALLPRYRGRAPMNWAIIRGETSAGLTVHYIDAGVDTGPILLQWRVGITPDTYISDLYDEMLKLYPLAVFSAIKGIESGMMTPIPQAPSQGFTCSRRTAADGRIDWHQTTEVVRNLVRGVSYPYPGAYTECCGEQIVVWRADAGPAGETVTPPGTVTAIAPLTVATGNGTLILTEYTLPAGRSALKVGDRFES